MAGQMQTFRLNWYLGNLLCFKIQWYFHQFWQPNSITLTCDSVTVYLHTVVIKLLKRMLYGSRRFWTNNSWVSIDCCVIKIPSKLCTFQKKKIIITKKISKHSSLPDYPLIYIIRCFTLWTVCVAQFNPLFSSKQIIEF